MSTMNDESHDVHAILLRISNTVAECSRKLSEHANLASVGLDLHTCKMILDRISTLVPTAVFHTTDQATEQMLHIRSLSSQGQHSSVKINVKRYA